MKNNNDLKFEEIGQIMNQTVGIVVSSYLTSQQKTDLIEKLRIIQGLALKTLRK